jgi:hypothetical protein
MAATHVSISWFGGQSGVHVDDEDVDEDDDGNNDDDHDDDNDRSILFDDDTTWHSTAQRRFLTCFNDMSAPVIWMG